jgi:apolipoprotein N-acyltransferase
MTLRTALQILWPAFLAAGAMALLVFAHVDPSDLHWASGARLAWSRQAVYTLAFFAFWAVIAAACALSCWLGCGSGTDARGSAD